MGHVITHDYLHQVFHYDKGIFYTVKELTIRPGHSIREYIQGKRVKHFNYLGLLIILFGLGHILYESPILHEVGRPVSSESYSFITWMDKYVTAYPKLFKLAQIPVFALVTWLMFKRAGLNFAEHIVLNAYITAYMFIVGFLCELIIVISNDINLIDPIHTFNSFLWVIYGTIFYYQFFSAYSYKKSGVLVRSLVATFSAMITVTLLLMGVYAVVTHASADSIRGLFK